jgi:hypothetical protein
VGNGNRTDVGVWQIGGVQGVNCAVHFRFERNYSEGLMKEPTRSGLQGTLKGRGNVKVRASVGTSGYELLKGKRIVETKFAAYISLSDVRGTK